MEEYIENAKQFTLDSDNLKHACELVASNLKTISFEEKRLALQALQVKVLVDGESVTIRGAVPVQSMGHIADSESDLHGHNNRAYFSFVLRQNQRRQNNC